MTKIFQNILIQYFQWHFFDTPKSIFLAWKNFLLFNLNYFSIPLLFKTFFSHWHKYRWEYPQSFDIKGYLETFFSNLFSRVMGAIVRFIFIIVGLLIEIFIFFIGIIVFLSWLFLPAFLIYGLYFGFKIIF